MTLLTASVALLLMQVGPNPSTGAMPGIPEELADRPPREGAADPVAPARLGSCLRQAANTPQAALDYAQAWRETASTDLEMAQSSHCLGLALVQLGRLSEAREIFELASAEAPVDNLAYSARLTAMAGNAALSQQDLDSALDLLDRAGGKALAAGDGALAADLRVDLARVLVRLDRPEDAAAALTEAREADGDDPQAWLLSATLSRRLSRLGEAQEQIERAALLSPRSAQVGLEAGVIAALSGREFDARGSFNSVLEVAPDSPQAEQARTYLSQLDARE